MLAQVIQARMILEVAAIGIATGRMTKERLQRLDACMQGMRETTADGLRFIDVDREFHLEIAQATDNAVLLGMYESMRQVFVELQLAVIQVPGAIERAIDTHESMLAALRKRDAQAARKAMRRHLARSSPDGRPTV
ncbi:MAG: FadR family transcriptional regulator [Acetomicrobium sp.]|nr:FadR family transcriptional regulator [Acetomicrobium sp.]